MISPLCRAVCARSWIPLHGGDHPTSYRQDCTPIPWGKNEWPFHNLEAEAARLRTRLAPVPQLAAREGLGAPRAPHEARRRAGQETVNFAHTRGAKGPGGTERAAHLERAQLPSGDLGVAAGARAQEAGVSVGK